MCNYDSLSKENFQVKNLQFNPPDVFDKDTPESQKKVFWSLVQLWKEGEHRTGEAEVQFKIAELSQKLGDSASLVRLRMRELDQNLNVIKRNSHNGQGRGIKVKILWVQYRLNRIKSKWWAKKFRKEDEFLKSRYPPAVGHHQLDRQTLAYKSNTNKDININEKSHQKSKNQKNKNKPLGPKNIFYRDIPNETKIEAETGLKSLVMGNVRNLLSGKDKIKETILSQFGKWLPNRTIREVREMVSALKDWFSRIRERLKWIWEHREKPEQVAHSVIRYFLNNLKLKPKSERLDGKELDQRKKEGKRKARKELGQHSGSSDLSAREKIEKALSAGAEILEGPDVSKAREGFLNFRKKLGLKPWKAKGSIRQGVKRKGAEKMLENLLNYSES